VAESRIAALYEKPHSVVHCDYVWKRTDMWINFPWSDKEPIVKRAGAARDA
jgi:hypoxanthine phosphoribosyltransferase